jgi:type IV secretory pathway TrbD component
MLDTHVVHRSLLIPPKLAGLERGLFFGGVCLTLPILYFGNLSIRAILAVLLLWALYYPVAAWATQADQHIAAIFAESLGYADYYQPLPHPAYPAPRPPDAVSGLF